jgi:O-antigen/teichoic acid export membrane protein
MDQGISQPDVALIKKRSLSGVASLVSRSFLVQAIALGANFFLTVFLDPATFGIFFLVSAFIGFFSYFSDIGLAAALIQKKEPLEDEDLKTTFLIQEILVIFLLTILFSLSFLVKKWYHLDQSALFLYYCLGISFFLSSLKTIPSILLERELKFNLLVIPQIFETIVFNLLVVFLAWKGFGIKSFSIAVLARGVIGLIVIYFLSPWKIGFAFSKSSLKRLLKFGLPFQINTFIAVAKDDLMTIVLGKIIGASGLGYLGWAKKWAEQPLRFLMDNVSRVAFPAFARLQDDRQRLTQAVEKSIFFLCFLTFPILTGFSVLASDLVKIIPRYLKWEPALLALYLYCFNSAWAVVSTSMTNLLNAIGMIKKTLKLMLMWLGLTWSLMPVLGLKFGYNGVAFATALIAFSSVVAVIVAKKQVNFNLSSTIFKPLLASVLMGILIYFARFNFVNLWLSLILRVAVAVIFYLIMTYLFLGKNVFLDIRQTYVEIRKKK